MVNNSNNFLCEPQAFVFRTNSTAAANSTFAIGGVSCSADSLEVAESFLHRINICGKNPAQRKSANRYAQCYDDSATDEHYSLQTNTVRTPRINSLFCEITYQSKVLEKKELGQSKKIDPNSHWVVSPRIELGSRV